MPRKHLFVPRLHERNVRRLYHHAHRLAMPVSRLLNLIVAVGLEELSQVNDPDEWERYEPVRPEEEFGPNRKLYAWEIEELKRPKNPVPADNSLCSDSPENASAPIVGPC